MLAIGLSFKKPSIIAVFIFVILSTFIFSSKVLAYSGNGSGTNSDPYQISTCTQLQSMDTALSASYELINNIDCSGFSFTPVGISTPFTGSLNGQYYTISGLDIDDTTSGQKVGLFSELSGATVSNLNFVNANITGAGDNSFVGTLAGDIEESNISHVIISGTVNGGYTGGLAGEVIGISSAPTVIDYSAFNGTVTSSYAYAGGLISYVYDANLSNDYANTDSVYSEEYTGGFIGDAYSDNTSNFITNSYSVSEGVTGYCGYTGGFASYSEGYTFTNDFASAVQVGCSGYSDGFIGADTNDINFTNDYCDTYVANQDGCVNSSNTGALVSAVDISGTDPDYFYSANSAPLSSWTFSTSGWIENSDGYPTIYNDPASNDTSSTSPTTSTTSVSPSQSPPDTGYGELPQTNPLVTILIGSGGISIIIGLALVYYQKRKPTI